jgi:hypothetical protein
MGAIGLLTADAFSTGHLTVTHALQPLLVLGTVAAAVLAHQSGWRRPVNTVLFLLLAGFGSLATIYGTLGRQADARDTKVGTALAENRTLQLRSEALDTAKADAKRECVSGVGQRCTNANARVDKLVGEMASLRTVSPDPRADTIADLLWLIASLDKARVRAIVAAVDPLVLPLFLELGSILFIAIAWPHRRTAIAVQLSSHANRTFTRDEALRDLEQLREAGSGRYLAHRWGVDPATASR